MIEFDEQLGKVSNCGYLKERQYNYGTLLMCQESMYENCDELVAKAMLPFSEEELNELSGLISGSAKKFEAIETFQKSLTTKKVGSDKPNSRINRR